MDGQDIQNRFAFHPATAAKGIEHAAVRNVCHEAADEINIRCPDSREKSLAITALEEAMMWANAAIARHDEDGDRL